MREHFWRHKPYTIAAFSIGQRKTALAGLEQMLLRYQKFIGLGAEQIFFASVAFVPHAIELYIIHDNYSIL